MEAKFKIKLEVTRQVLCAFHMIFCRIALGWSESISYDDVTIDV